MLAKFYGYAIAGGLAALGLLLSLFGVGLLGEDVVGFGVETMGRLLLALGLSAAVGTEREAREKPAGMRTVAIVGVGSCLFALIGMHLAGGEDLSVVENRDGLARVIQGIITGVGFLGAGTIIKEKFDIEGLTTAASLWAVAGVGVACGLGYVELALLATAAILSVLIALRTVDMKIHGQRQ